jgi:pantoate--beta-alanine ligase
MQIVRTVAALRDLVASWRARGESVAVVPTMGALHQGHLSLVEAARREADHAIVTLFVNPKQFTNPDDLKNYPRTEESDRAALAPLGVDVLFAPGASEVYPPGFATTVSVARLGDVLCGAHRPGHFDGVATVVAKLFVMTGADLAFFGEKDWQQLQIVRRMARDLDLPVAIRPMPTIREPDGLAMSSRNQRLSPDERERAAAMPRVMRLAGRAILAGERAGVALEQARHGLLAAGFREVDYVELRDGETLRGLDAATPGARIFAAAWIGHVRLIDNMSLEETR